MSFQMYIPTKILFGCGLLEQLHEQTLPGKHALLLISNGKSAKAGGYLAKTEEQLTKAGVAYSIFAKIEPNPLKSTVMEGAAFAKANNCDFIVALGGGSVMDAAKAIATMATNPGDLWDYVGGGTGKGLAMSVKPLPLVTITTTAGTGSEVDPWGVITNSETHEKIGYGGSDDLYPVLSIVDPDLMRSVPPKFTAFQGFDALFHSVECYVSNVANLMGDMYALTAIANVAGFLARAVNDGNDMEAREKVAFANTLSGVAMTVSGCTSEHSLEHAMSAYHQELPHGAGLILISRAYFTNLIENHVCDERFINMAQAMGVASPSDPMDFIVALTQLQANCGVADLKMTDFGITEDEFDKMATNAKETMGGLFQCDRRQLSHDDCVSIYAKSFK